RLTGSVDAEGLERVDAGRSRCRNVAGHEGDDAQKHEASGVRERIVRLDLEQHGAEHTRDRDGPEQSEDHAGGGGDGALADHHAQNHALGLWKEADAAIPVVSEARAEYARLP